MLPEVTFDFYGEDGLAWTVLHVSAREGLSKLYRVRDRPCGRRRPDARRAARQDGRAHDPTGGLHAERSGAWFATSEDLGSTATHRHVRVGLAPRLWLLSQRVDSRIFQEMTAVEIVCDVLQRAGVYQEPAGWRRTASPCLPRRGTASIPGERPLTS